VAGEDEEVGSSAQPTPPQVSYPVSIRASHHGQISQAKLLDAAGRVRYNGVEYQSPSGAGKAGSGWQACNGWFFWRFQNS
jgi:hypothetical protein